VVQTFVKPLSPERTNQFFRPVTYIFIVKRTKVVNTIYVSLEFLFIINFYLKTIYKIRRINRLISADILMIISVSAGYQNKKTKNMKNPEIINLPLSSPTPPE
jgi:hypothetical protein